jgi:tetratricopeptide (TPR) repeat protein
LRAWTSGHWLRGVFVAGTILSLIGATIGGWAYLATVALKTGQLTPDIALKTYDAGNYEEARNIVGHMLTGGSIPRSDFGTPLFVLGAIKTRDAENQAVPERRRIEYLIASRYLTEARAYGLPPEREAQGVYLQGVSLIESGQFEEGFEVLHGLALSSNNADQKLACDAQRILSDTCLVMPHERPDDALRYNVLLVANAQLSEDEHTAALVQRAVCLSRLERFTEAQQALSSIQSNPAAAPLVKLTSGTILLDEVEANLHKLPESERAQAVSAMADKIKTALEDFATAQQLDQQKSKVSQQACYEAGRGLALKGDAEGALKQFLRTRQLYADSVESLAAALGEADVLREKGDFETALPAYRRVLDSYGEMPVYRSLILPVAAIRERILAALNSFNEHQHFAESINMLDHFTPLYARTEQLELRGNSLEQWGSWQLTQTDQEAEPDKTNDLRSSGLEHLRAAGVAFEQLAELRFATKFYTSDLWRAAGDFFQGQSFSRAIDALQKYLRYEPELRNAQALLRLGQAHLALGQIPQSIAALEECIEFHPLDSSTFQARIDCAKAYWYKGDTDRAERLLRDNIAGSSLKPLSPEWKDSLFELGMLLHEKEKFEDAIGTLEEAVARYPQDSQRLVAQYVIGESYRRCAQALLADAQKSRTASEHTKTMEQVNQKLSTALSHFEEVQRAITLKTHDIHGDPLMGTMLRNCYMLEGAVLFDLGRYKEAIEAYSNVSSLYPDEPFVLETFVQIANCWRRLNRHDNARGAVHQAQIVLDRLPPTSDFASTTVLNREEWRMLLTNMSKW